MALRKIGALWINAKESKTAFSGIIETLNGNVRVQIFPNDKNRTEGDRKPDFNICISVDELNGDC